MSWQATQHAVKARTRTSTQKLVLLALAHHAHADGDGAFPSIPLLSEETGLGKSTISRALSQLEQGGFITRGDQTLNPSRRPGRRSTVWRILPRTTTPAPAKTGPVHPMRTTDAMPDMPLREEPDTPATPTGIVPNMPRQAEPTPTGIVPNIPQREESTTAKHPAGRSSNTPQRALNSKGTINNPPVSPNATTNTETTEREHAVRACALLTTLRADRHLTTPNPTRRDIDALTRLAHRLATVEGDPDPWRTIHAALPTAVSRDWWARKADRGFRFADNFDRIRNDTQIDRQATQRATNPATPGTTGPTPGNGLYGIGGTNAQRARTLLARHAYGEGHDPQAERDLTARLEGVPAGHPDEARLVQVVLAEGRARIDANRRALEERRAGQAKAEADAKAKLDAIKARNGGHLFAGFGRRRP